MGGRSAAMSGLQRCFVNVLLANQASVGNGDVEFRHHGGNQSLRYLLPRLSRKFSSRRELQWIRGVAHSIGEPRYQC
jgi:hypothetical protein